MTAQQLHDLTKDLFAKHQSAKTWQIDYMEMPCVWQVQSISGRMDVTNQISCDAAALIITGHLVEWLAEKSKRDLGIWSPTKNSDGWDVDCNWQAFRGHATLLEALIAACMEVPQ